VVEIKIKFSRDQWDALVDNCLYGMPYGMEIGEDEHIAKELKKLGYTRADVTYVKMDDKNYFHIFNLKDSK